MSNLTEYENSALYDQEQDHYVKDVLFLKSWAKGVSGSIIDLACGTGRVTYS
ncbi:hypothetical protein [Alkalibacillus haloalkaliphilus]|uniref:hypothetical protein n=1 Tax=Alkalibacillus haloalkaliphilus TaxID=94136 RepID=UPI00031B9B9B|nr:hypothetical protein [Alkalibacillus haloalkaliphilus]